MEEMPMVDFGTPVDKSKNIIKVIGVGGGGCNAVRNMYNNGILDVSFAVCNTDSKVLANSPVPVKILLGASGLGAGGNPDIGREEALHNADDIKALLDDGTHMVFVTAGMGGGTGTGAAPVVAGIAKEKGLLTVGIVTLPFYFEKRNKIIKALKGVEEMRKNVDALLIINNERLCDVYADSEISVKESFHKADNILADAAKSISELITVEGDINLDFRDIEATLRGGGGAIMAMGRAGGEHRVKKAIHDALNSPLLYGSDINKAKRILFNIYTDNKRPLFVSEMREIDAFMDSLSPDIDVIWGLSDDNTLGEDAKITILATGLDNEIAKGKAEHKDSGDDRSYDEQIERLYSWPRDSDKAVPQTPIGDTVFKVGVGDGDGGIDVVSVDDGGTQSDESDMPSDNDGDDVVSLPVGENDDMDEDVTEDSPSDNDADSSRPVQMLEKIRARMASFAIELMKSDD